MKEGVPLDFGMHHERRGVAVHPRRPCPSSVTGNIFRRNVGLRVGCHALLPSRSLMAPWGGSLEKLVLSLRGFSPDRDLGGQPASSGTELRNTQPRYGLAIPDLSLLMPTRTAEARHARDLAVALV